MKTSNTLRPEGAPDPVLAAAAAHVARAEREHAAAADVAVEKRAAAGRLRNRLAELAAARSEIASRRARGEQHPDDGSALALLALDGEGVERLLAGADAAAVAAEAPRQTAERALQAARFELQRLQDRAHEQALVGHAERLAELLLQTCRGLSVVAQRLGRPDQHAWAPNDDVWHELRRRTAMAGRL